MSTETPLPSSPFLDKAKRALEQLFELARQKDELNFALSLAPEFKAYTLTSAMDAANAYREYCSFLELKQFHHQPIRTRIALALYCHVAEAAGLWGVPMCMLGVLEGEKYTTSPFEHLVRNHKVSGELVAPNANRVMGTMAGCASSLGLDDLASVFRDAFDPDIRNGFAHSDYALSQEGLHVRGRHDRARIISWAEFHRLLMDGVGLFETLREVIRHYERYYQTPRIVNGTTNEMDPVGPWLIHSDPATKTMVVSGGAGVPLKLLIERAESITDSLASMQAESTDAQR